MGDVVARCAELRRGAARSFEQRFSTSATTAGLAAPLGSPRRDLRPPTPTSASPETTIYDVQTTSPRPRTATHRCDVEQRYVRDVDQLGDGDLLRTRLQAQFACGPRLQPRAGPRSSDDRRPPLRPAHNTPPDRAGQLSLFYYSFYLPPPPPYTSRPTRPPRALPSPKRREHAHVHNDHSQAPEAEGPPTKLPTGSPERRGGGAGPASGGIPSAASSSSKCGEPQRSRVVEPRRDDFRPEGHRPRAADDGRDARPTTQTTDGGDDSPRTARASAPRRRRSSTCEINISCLSQVGELHTGRHAHPATAREGVSARRPRRRRRGGPGAGLGLACAADGGDLVQDGAGGQADAADRKRPRRRAPAIPARPRPRQASRAASGVRPRGAIGELHRRREARVDALRRRGRGRSRPRVVALRLA